MALPSEYNISLLFNVLQFKGEQKQTWQFSNLKFWINESEMIRGEYKLKDSVLEFPKIKIQRFVRNNFQKRLVISLLSFSKD